MHGDKANHDQDMRWNGAAGKAWVELQVQLDAMLAPFERLLLDAVCEQRPRSVLDIGCGTGATTLAIARQLGEQVACTGVDISQPMIALARARAAQQALTADFIEADAQTWPFAAASFDMVVSRMGVMFFDDPVRAFANLRRATVTDGALRFIAWRSAEENPFMTTAERAAAPLLPALPPRRPGEPGQFGMADRAQITRILEQAGWGEIDIRPADEECTLPARELLRYATLLGPVGQLLQKENEDKRAEVEAALRDAFQPFVRGDEARFTAACWMVGARAR
ncbi:class I SAM-dependent methyltransferase [Duganella sp. LX20W]|uniref:Class I SAM-dependent methyltransferase n=1 Tax=Rugamonas brunnea TaxID=2758569 RepID=A0A7W2EU93_9BURK|nr:class I SAM-dependent methyltransferase [Rugamonas brunnea]MBA5638686.1 class I SAM-dependent methyltransferase [Rugamonas brunnea]